MRLLQSHPVPAKSHPIVEPAFWSAAASSARASTEFVPGLRSEVTTRELPTLNAGDVSQRFGVRLRSMRAARSMTQQDMARRFGIDRSFISDVERGRKSISLVTLEVLALGLGVSISELLSDV